MKRRIGIGRIVLGLVFLCLPAALHAAALGSLRVSLIEGDVQIRTDETEDWVAAAVNTPLKEGDRIWVPEGGRFELQIKDGSILRLDQQSALEIFTTDRDSGQFYLTEGRAFVQFAATTNGFLQIDTPVSSLRVYNRTTFRADVSEEGGTEISVFRGSVYAENQDGKTRIGEGKTLTLKEGYISELAPLGEPDDWEQWNRDRDRRLAARPLPSRNLPPELAPYSRDFEENGRWISAPGYGIVWVPKVGISAGWAPYRLGRWVWIGGDYVWVSSEPWGWAPYHYGRWTFAAAIGGWCWVPPARGGVYWGPGFVGWVSTPAAVSWVPLAPGEIYYGYGYYGPWSVNITNINVNRIDVHRVVYRNIRVREAVTVVDRDGFLTGRHGAVRGGENPFLSERIHVGRPDIRPERATFMPSVRDIPESRRPPEAIRNMRVREIRERRPMVREREASVLRPGASPGEMPMRMREGRPVLREGERPRDRASGDVFRSRRPGSSGPAPGRTGRPLDRKTPERLRPGEGGKPGRGVPVPQERRSPGKVGPEGGRGPGNGQPGFQKPRLQGPLEKGPGRSLERGGPGVAPGRPRDMGPGERAPGRGGERGGMRTPGSERPRGGQGGGGRDRDRG